MLLSQLKPLLGSKMGRAPSCSKVGLRRGPWTAEEDMLLTKVIQDNGEGRWRALPKKAGLLRCGKSCRLRWLNYLRPDIKRGNITPDEEELIIRMHKLLGNRWSLIAGRLPGRTDNDIKNFWNTQLSKKLVKKGIDPKTHQPVFRKEDGRVSTDFVNKEEHPTTKKKNVDSDRKNVSDRHVQPVHLPKATRYIALPPFVGRPHINGLSDFLLSPSIYLSSPCSMSILNSSQDSEYFSAEMLCLQSPVNGHVPQSSRPHKANDNSQDFFPWLCTDEENERSLSNFQSEGGGSLIPNDICVTGNEQIGLSGANISIPSPQPKLEFGHINKPENYLSGELQKVYEEYLDLLREDPTENNSGALISNRPDDDGEDVPVLQKHFSSMWDRF